MNRIDRGIAVGLIGSAVALGGCSNEDVGTGSGAGGGGGGEPAPVPRLIEVALRTNADARLDALVVFHNAADGRLLETVPGAELPAKLTVQDGDWVSYANLGGFRVQFITSYRVEAGVERIEQYRQLPVDEASACGLEWMELHVTVPEVEGATEAFVQTSTGYSEVASSLPALVVVYAQYSVCETPDLSLFVGAKGPAFEAVAVVEGIPFESGAVLELAPELAPPPRTSFQIDVSGLDEALLTEVESTWRGARYALASGALFAPDEEVSNSTHADTSPFSVVHTPMNLPSGHPHLSVVTTHTNDAGSCRRSSWFGRVGESEEPFSVDARALAEARPVGERGYSLEPGRELGDHVRQLWESPETLWYVYVEARETLEDLPELELPDELPVGFKRSSAPFEFRSISHADVHEVAGYAASLASSDWAVPWTARARSFELRCDDAE